jgi:hypothetical protein
MTSNSGNTRVLTPPKLIFSVLGTCHYEITKLTMLFSNVSSQKHESHAPVCYRYSNCKIYPYRYLVESRQISNTLPCKTPGVRSLYIIGSTASDLYNLKLTPVESAASI